MNFSRENIGWGLVLVGGVLQIAEGLAQADATVANIQFNETAVGSLVDPIESKLPIPLGWSLIAAGAIILWLVPLVKG